MAVPSFRVYGQSTTEPSIGKPASPHPPARVGRRCQGVEVGWGGLGAGVGGLRGSRRETCQPSTTWGEHIQDERDVDLASKSAVVVEASVVVPVDSLCGGELDLFAAAGPWCGRGARESSAGPGGETCRVCRRSGARRGRGPSRPPRRGPLPGCGLGSGEPAIATTFTARRHAWSRSASHYFHACFERPGALSRSRAAAVTFSRTGVRSISTVTYLFPRWGRHTCSSSRRRAPR